MSEVPQHATIAVVLAAGASTRLGRPKQALQFGGQSLLEHVVNSALESEIGMAIVVVGANAELCRSLLRSIPVVVEFNANWQAGVSSSIAVGLDVVDRFEEDTGVAFESVVFLTCDQPFLSSDLLNEMVKAYHAEPASIVACEYGGTLGVPALFSRKYYGELRKLRGDRGARSLIVRHAEDVVSVPFPNGQVDIDIESDLHLFEALSGQ